MNRFRIARSFEDAFETMWRERDSHLADVPGFREFHLLKGTSDGEATVFASHTLWDSRAAFDAWVESDAFRKAHAGAKSPEGMHLGPPKLELFEVVV